MVVRKPFCCEYLHRLTFAVMSCCRIKQPAVAPVLGHSKDGKVAYYVLTKDRLEVALDILVKCFYPDEPACSLLQVSESDEAVKELNLLMVETAKDNASLVAVETESNTVIGVCFNKIQVKSKPGELPFFEKFKRETSKSQKAISLIDFMSEVDCEVDIFETFNVEKVVEFVFLAVLPTYRNRGIGLDLLAHSLEFARSKALAPVACMIGTSIFTQRIGRKLNFKNLAELPYKKNETNQNVFEKVTSLHDRSILFAKQL